MPIRHSQKPSRLRNYYASGQQCSIVIAPVNEHQSFYITSGTGGLQEALNANMGNPAANTIILSNQWYVQGGTTAIIGQVRGSTSIGLVDVTTTPYTAYVWNGTQYVATGGTGGSFTPNTDLGGTALQTNVVGINGQNLAALGAGIYKFSSIGVPSKAVAGTDYVIPAGTVATAGTAGNVTGIVQLANGGTGTTAPGLIAGANVTISGAWPNQTITSTGGSGGFTPTQDLGGTSTATKVIGINGQNLAALGAGVLQQNASGVPSIAATAALLGTDISIPSASGPFNIYQLPCIDANLGITTSICGYYYPPGPNLQAAVNYVATTTPGAKLALGDGIYPVSTATASVAGLALPATNVCVNLAGNGQLNTNIKFTSVAFTISGATADGAHVTFNTTTDPTANLAVGNTVALQGLTLFPTLANTTAAITSITTSGFTIANTVAATSGTETGTAALVVPGAVTNAASFSTASILASGGVVSVTLATAPTSLQLVAGSKVLFNGMTVNTALNYLTNGHVMYTLTGVSGSTITFNSGASITNGTETGTTTASTSGLGCFIRDINIDANWEATNNLYLPFGRNWNVAHLSFSRTTFGGADLHLGDSTGGGPHFYEAAVEDINCDEVTSDYTALSVPKYCLNADVDFTDSKVTKLVSQSTIFGVRAAGGGIVYDFVHTWGTYGPTAVAVATAGDYWHNTECDDMQGTPVTGGSGACFLLNAGSDGTLIEGTNVIGGGGGTTGAVFAYVATGVGNLKFVHNDWRGLLNNTITQAIYFNGTRACTNYIAGNLPDFGQTSFNTACTITPTGAAATWDVTKGINQTLTLAANNTVVTITSPFASASQAPDGLPGKMLQICQPSTGSPFTGGSFSGFIMDGQFPPPVLGACTSSIYINQDGQHEAGLKPAGISNKGLLIDDSTAQQSWNGRDAGYSLSIFDYTAPFTSDFCIGGAIAGQKSCFYHDGSWTSNNGATHGSIQAVAASTPAAPVVTPNTTGSTTYVYSCQSVDSQNGASAQGATTTITNGNATPNNQVVCPSTSGAKTFNIYNATGIIGNVVAYTQATAPFVDTGQTPTAAVAGGTSGIVEGNNFQLQSANGLYDENFYGGVNGTFTGNKNISFAPVNGTITPTSENDVTACTGSIGFSTSASFNKCILTGATVGSLSTPLAPISAQASTLSVCQTGSNTFGFTFPSSFAAIGGTAVTVPAGSCYNYSLTYDSNASLYQVTGTNVSSGSSISLTTTGTTGAATLSGSVLNIPVYSSGASGVSSFNTRTGAVVPASGDYTVSQVTGAAPLASPALTGVPTVPTATVGTNTTQAASTAFVLANAGGTQTNYVIGTGPSSDQALTAAYTAGGTTMTVTSTTGYFTPTASIPLGYILVGFANGAINVCSYSGLTSTQFTGLTCGLFNIASVNEATGAVVEQVKAFTANSTATKPDFLSLWNGKIINTPSSTINSYSFNAYDSTPGSIFANTDGNGTKIIGLLTFVPGAGSGGQISANSNNGLTLAGQDVFTSAGAASQPGLTVSGAPYTAGTGTTNFPQLYVSTTGATAPTTLSTAGTMFGVNAPSGFAGNLCGFYVNGTGEITCTAAGILSSNGLNTNGTINFTSTPYALSWNSGDLKVARAAANTLEVGNSTNAAQGILEVAAVLPGLLYSAAGTALPTCAVGLKGQQATVSDATSPTYMGAYTSGGGITTAVICSYNGTTYSWLTH